ncbi:MAG: ion channel [Henriciella sp.]|jgi:hypothetical protein
MLTQIGIGSSLIVLTIIVMAIFVGLAIRFIEAFAARFARKIATFKLIVALVLVTLFMLAGLSLSIWIWALAFFWLGAFDTILASLYFSMVAFTTLGFGDLTLPNEWKLQSGFIAANGLILFGFVTAFLMEFFGQLRRSHDEHRHQKDRPK